MFFICVFVLFGLCKKVMEKVMEVMLGVHKIHQNPHHNSKFCKKNRHKKAQKTENTILNLTQHGSQKSYGSYSEVTRTSKL